MVNNNRQRMDLMNYNIQKAWQREKSQKTILEKKRCCMIITRRILYTSIYMSSASTTRRKIVPIIEQASTSDNKF